MTEADKKILFTLNSRLVELSDEMNELELTPGNEEKIEQKEKTYRRVLAECVRVADIIESRKDPKTTDQLSMNQIVNVFGIDE